MVIGGACSLMLANVFKGCYDSEPRQHVGKLRLMCLCYFIANATVVIEVYVTVLRKLVILHLVSFIVELIDNK